MRGDIRHLNPVNIVVSFYHVVKPMLPMHRHQGKPLFIRKQKSCVSIHHSLVPWCFPSSIMAWKHRNTSSDIGSFLVPALVFVDSITSRISEVLCSWWSMFMIRFFISDPSMSVHKIPRYAFLYEKGYKLLRNTYSTHYRHGRISRTAASVFW